MKKTIEITKWGAIGTAVIGAGVKVLEYFEQRFSPIIMVNSATLYQYQGASYFREENLYKF